MRKDSVIHREKRELEEETKALASLEAKSNKVIEPTLAMNGRETKKRGCSSH